MPTCRAIATPERMMTWFCAITVTVAPVIASRPMAPSLPLPISILSPTKRPRYWSMNFVSVSSGMPSNRIGSL
jgi:hypothetical protein